jgi:hypothetical protein
VSFTLISERSVLGDGLPTNLDHLPFDLLRFEGTLFRGSEDSPDRAEFASAFLPGPTAPEPGGLALAAAGAAGLCGYALRRRRTAGVRGR